MEEEAVVVVAGGALAVAGAEIQIEAGVQLVAESSGVGVAAVGQVGLGVGSEECVVAGAEAVGQFGVEACGEWSSAEGQFCGIVVEEWAFLLEEIELVGAALPEGGL